MAKDPQTIEWITCPECDGLGKNPEEYEDFKKHFEENPEEQSPNWEEDVETCKCCDGHGEVDLDDYVEFKEQN